MPWLGEHNGTVQGRNCTLESQADEMATEISALKSADRQIRTVSPSTLASATASNLPLDHGDHGIQSHLPPLTLVSVHKELEDKRKRAANVVVHGLQPRDGEGDDAIFARFMEEHLPVKPAFDRTKCRRLGKPQAGKTQPLLVAFNNTIGAADVLASTGSLRRSAPTVFINADQTRAEAQLAYEERVRRRERRLRRDENGSGAGAMTATSAGTTRPTTTNTDRQYSLVAASSQSSI